MMENIQNKNRLKLFSATLIIVLILTLAGYLLIFNDQETDERNSEIRNELIKKITNKALIEDLRNNPSQENKIINNQTYKKNYNPSKKNLKIRDGSDNILLDMDLTSPYFVSGVIASSNSKVAEFLLVDWEAGKSNLFDSVEYFDKKNNNGQISKTFSFKYGTENQNCEAGYCFNYTTWTDFTSLSELPRKNIKIGVFTQTTRGERVEWVPTIEGFEILEWAIWDVSTAKDFGLNISINPPSAVPFGLFFNDTGDRMYIIDRTNDEVYMFNLSTPFNVTTSLDNPSKAFSIPSAMTAGDIFIGNNGTTMIVTSDAGPIESKRFTLSTAWDTSSATADANVCGTSGTPYAVSMNPGGTLLFIGSGGDILTFTLSSGFDLSTCSSAGSFNPADVGDDIQAITFGDGGTKLYLTSNTDNLIHQFNLSIAYNFSSGVPVYENKTIALPESSISGLYIHPDGLGIYAVGNTLDLVMQYDIFPSLIPDITVNLSSPADNSKITNSSLTFTANFNVSNGNFTNTTLFVWYSNTSVFKTNTTVITGNESNSTTSSISNLSFGETYLWNYKTCAINNSLGVACVFADDNRTFSRKEYSEDAITFASFVNETSLQNLSINITTLDVILSVTANLNYNGTLYPSLVSCSIPTCSISNLIDIPLVEKGNSQNKTFFWNITTTSSSQSFNSVTDTQQQNVSRITLAPCNSTLTTQFINFTTYDAINPNPSINVTFKSTWSYWLGSGNSKRNNSYENLSETNSTFIFCGDPFEEIRLEAEFEFDATNYQQNHHYYSERNISTSSFTEQRLYLLESGNATLTVIKVVDDLQKGLEDRLVEIILFDVGTGEEKIVSMARTDHLGEDIVYLNWFDSFYKIKVFKNGILELTIEPYKIGSTPQTFKVIPEGIFFQDKFKEVVWSLSYNNATNEFVLIYNDPNNEISGGCLRVVKGAASNYSILSDECLSAPAGTLNYNIGVNQTGVYLAAFYVLGSFDILDTLMIVLRPIENLFDLIGSLDATILVFILVGTSTMLGLLVSGVIGILLLFGGFIAAMALGFVNMSVLPQFIAMASIGGYLMWKLRT